MLPYQQQRAQHEQRGNRDAEEVAVAHLVHEVVVQNGDAPVADRPSVQPDRGYQGGQGGQQRGELDVDHEEGIGHADG